MTAAITEGEIMNHRIVVAMCMCCAGLAIAQAPKSEQKVDEKKSDTKMKDTKMKEEKMKEEKVAMKAMSADGKMMPAMDMAKMGPWTRKPANEAAIKKEIADFFKEEDALAAKGDQEAMLARVDFPVFMVTDDAKGAVEAKGYSRDEYVATMKPFYESMPKDLKTTHKPQVTVLSDSMVNVVDEFAMTSSKGKFAGRNMGLLVKTGGTWKWKTMAEAGWGGMSGGMGGMSGEMKQPQ